MINRLYLLVEGQTEETFVRTVLTSHYARIGLFITPVIVSTSLGHKGGITNYEKVKPQINRLCKQDRKACVSTLFDLYGLPGNFPGKDEADFPAHGTGEQKADFLEKKLAEDIKERNFIPNLMVHEFETLLFVEPGKFSDWTDAQSSIDLLISIAQKHKNPEHINDSPQTAPSKRIKKLMPWYEKNIHGPLIVAEIGLDSLRQACPHFNRWLQCLEQLAI